MRISVIAKTSSKIEKIEQISEGEFKVSFSVQPIENRANIKIIELLSDYFDVPKSSISIVRGLKSKNKTIDIND